MVSPSPQPPSYPTPQSPPPPPADRDRNNSTTTAAGTVHPLAQASFAPQEPPERVKHDHDIDMAQAPSTAPQAADPMPPPAPTTLLSPLAPSAPKPEPLDADLATFTSAASARAAPAPRLDTTSPRKPSLVGMLTASASASRSQSPRTITAADDDRKPDLPPPFPFASTSASAADVDARRSSAKAESGASTPSGSGSGSRTPKREDVEDDQGVVRKGSTAAGARSDKGKGKGSAKGAKGADVPEPQLIGHLPVASAEAGRTFVELDESTYANKSIGDVKYYEPDMARCDCSPDSTVSDDEQSCGELSNCMNRLMQIECLKGDCKCGDQCRNQRFQNREYAPIEVVKTEKKGFGVRAEADIPADAFVYEYVGEVIGPKPFEAKMKAYANDGIKHFYFMALDRDVFIDATKKGGKGRFLNHSCNPNCYVSKWTVGKKMRMGIFTKRAVKMHEELTFNYNVDRYGHVAQECFCGEPNCIGFIGGKTQTDIGGMDDLYIDALGITDEVEQLELKGNKKKKGKKLDEDFTPTLHPVQLDEVPKVSSAIRQALQTRRILEKLLTRVQMTTDDEVLRGLMRLHGLNLMNNVLREYPQDVHVILLDLEILAKWKLQTRNKIESSRIEESVTRCLDVADERVQTLAKDVLAAWAELQLAYRIPKALLDASTDPDRKRPSSFDFDSLAKRARYDEPSPSTDDDQRPAFVRPQPNTTMIQRRSRALPDGWHVEYDRESDRDLYINLYTGARQRDRPSGPAPQRPPSHHAQGERARAPAVVLDANELIKQAEAQAREALEAEERRAKAERDAREAERSERAERKRAEKEEKGARVKDKMVMGLFSTVVVNTMSKYKGEFEPDAFKKRAREVSELLVEKEKKRPSYATDSYESLAPEKEAKVRSFVKDWVKKLLERKKANGASTSSSSSARRPSTSSASTPRPGVLPSPATPTVSGFNGHSNGAGPEAGTPQ
ncbi:hypothetical protein JCM8208_007302 [Rhodotorula glutinis]